MKKLLTISLICLLVSPCSVFGKNRVLPFAGIYVFGTWKVVGYRFGDGISGGERQAKGLLGRVARYGSSRASFGKDVCSLPSYMMTVMSEDSFFRDYRSSLESIGVKGGRAQIIEVLCGGKDWDAPGSLLIKLPRGRLLTFWDGIYFVLEKQKSRQGKRVSVTAKLDTSMQLTLAR